MVQSVSSENFTSALAMGKVLVDFYASWCGPCKAMAPILEELSQSRNDLSVVKVDIDEAKEIVEKYQISSVPTLILFKDGTEVARVVGMKDRSAIEELIDKS